MKNESLETRYLLGKLSTSEAARLEERYFVEDGVFDEIETAEDELVDAYAQGSLSAEDRKQFEEKLLSSKRIAERVEFTKLLSKLPSPQLVSHELEPAPWWKKLVDFSFIPNAALRAAVVAGIFLLVIGSPTALVVMRLRDERRLNDERFALEQEKLQLDQKLTQEQSRTETALRNSKAEKDLAQRELQAVKDELARITAQPGAPASIVLFAGLVRGPGQHNRLPVPSTASTIQLKLVVDSDDYPEYRATIKSSTDRVVLTKPNLKTIQSGKVRMILLQFESRRVRSGDYAVSLEGRTPSGTYEPFADYSVRVRKN